MPRLLFFSRVALICNLCFLVTYLMHYVPSLENGIVSSTIIVLGVVVSIVINVLMTSVYAFLVMTGKRFVGFVPLWIVVVNLVFLIVQVILLVK